DAESIANLEKSLRLNRQVYNEKRRQLSEDQRQQSLRDREREQQRSSPPEQPASQPTSAPAAHVPSPATKHTPDRTIRLEYPGGRVDIGVQESEELKLLKALELAGMRAV
ncbi:hypothetical protein, partial [Kistimonas scapharcae]|uniref:hypothetical protein n=1 Tax=Kistimonas scapharcae TaxID=1036133 RepID=UPI0031F0F6D8